MCQYFHLTINTSRIIVIVYSIELLNLENVFLPVPLKKFNLQYSHEIYSTARLEGICESTSIDDHTPKLRLRQCLRGNSEMLHVSNVVCHASSIIVNIGIR